LEGKGGRPEGYCHRQMIDAVHYLADNGIKWQAMPADLPPWPRSPRQSALVSMLQFAENLSDCAADAVRTRIDWKYGLGLELDEPGFDYSLLSEFRARLAECDGADQLLQLMLDRLVAAGLVKRRGRQRTDATQAHQAPVRSSAATESGAGYTQTGGSG